MTSYTITLSVGKDKFNINVTQKKIKSLRLKLTANGDIFLSTPMRYSQKKATQFVENKSQWIAKSVEQLKSVKVDKYCSFNQNDTIYIWGEKRSINIIQSNKNFVDIDNQNLNIYLVCPNNENARKVFLSWAKNYFYGHLVDMYEIVYRTIFKKLKVRKPQLTIRTMKTMWGNCKYNKEIITLNFYLFKTPIECINYVILHELAHLIYHDHSKNFQDFLSTYMPDWKERKKKLNQYSLQF